MSLIRTKAVTSRQPLLLVLWIFLGAGLRFTNLDGKPAWIDEFATIVFILGNSFKSVPIDRVINFQDLLAPLINHPNTTVGDVSRLLFTEDVHPPTYFALAHLWMNLFPTDGGFVNIWAARALPALFGILTIPAMYICTYYIFRSQSIANFAAATIALSPFTVYVSQEARHYSPAILWALISASCLAIACQYLYRREKLSIPLIVTWIIANNLGIATHYFFSIALAAQALTLGLFVLWQARESQTIHTLSVYLSAIRKALLDASSRRFYLVLLGTVAGVAMWGWLFFRSYDSTLTDWLKGEPQPFQLIQLINPPIQMIAVWVPIMSLLLLEMPDFPLISMFGKSIDLNLPVMIISGVLMLIFFIWVIPILKRGLTIQLQQSQTKIGTVALIIYIVSSIGIYLGISWFTGMDLSRIPRYHFVYVPAITMLIGLALDSCWQTSPSLAKWVSGKQAVTIVILMGFISSAIVVTNYGYHKYYRPDQIVPMIQQSAPIPVLIASTHNSLVQVGEMMGVAWEMRRVDRVKQSTQTQFIFAHQRQSQCKQDCSSTNILRQTVYRISHPIDLWLINFRAPVSLPPTCHVDHKFTQGVLGYEYKLYHCQPIKDMN